MSEMISDFTSLMTWFILSLNSLVVALLVWYALRLPHGRQRAIALVGCLGMMVILVAVGVSLFFFSLRGMLGKRSINQLLFPLLTPILTLSFYRLTFPESARSSTIQNTSSVRSLSVQKRLLLFFTCLACLFAGSLIAIEFLFS